MRTWRKGYLRPELEAMAAEGRDPTPEEWAEMEKRIEVLHAAIQGS